MKQTDNTKAERGARLRKARQEAGFSTLAKATKAFGWHYQNTLDHERGRVAFTFDRALIYADAFGCSAAWLMYGDDAPEASAFAAHRCPVLGAAEAGVWREKTEHRRQVDEMEPIAFVPDERFKLGDQYAIFVRGSCLDEIITPGGYVIVVPIEIALGEKVSTSSLAALCKAYRARGEDCLVVIQRTRGTLIETSLRELVLSGGRLVLRYRSRTIEAADLPAVENDKRGSKARITHLVIAEQRRR